MTYHLFLSLFFVLNMDAFRKRKFSEDNYHTNKKNRQYYQHNNTHHDNPMTQQHIFVEQPNTMTQTHYNSIPQFIPENQYTKPNMQPGKEIMTKLIKQLMDNQKKLESNNSKLTSEISELKTIIINLQDMYQALYGELMDYKQQYFNEMTPIDPSNCSYLN